jgi:DNA-binding response OmpR family regulator
MSPMRVLIVEDSARLRESLGKGLRYSNFSVDETADAESALLFLRAQAYPLVILDLSLPKMDGLQLLRLIRKDKLAESVLVLSARDRVQDRTEALNLGADDYLVKPFDFDELLARLNALTRRNLQQRNPVIECGDLFVDTALKRVSIAGRPIKLPSREYQVLELLLRRRKIVLSRHQIFESLSNADRDATDRVIEVVVSNLRKKLGDAGLPELIRTERGQGYVIE